MKSSNIFDFGYCRWRQAASSPEKRPPDRTRQKPIAWVFGLIPHRARKRPGAERQGVLLLRQYLSALSAKFLQAYSDRREIVGGVGSGRHTFPPFVCRRLTPV